MRLLILVIAVLWAAPASLGQRNHPSSGSTGGYAVIPPRFAGLDYDISRSAVHDRLIERGYTFGQESRIVTYYNGYLFNKWSTVNAYWDEYLVLKAISVLIRCSEEDLYETYNSLNDHINETYGHEQEISEFCNGLEICRDEGDWIQSINNNNHNIYKYWVGSDSTKLTTSPFRIVDSSGAAKYFVLLEYEDLDYSGVVNRRQRSNADDL